MALPDGYADTTTDVHWLPGPAYYADLRQPAGRPDFPTVSCLHDLTLQQVDWLAQRADRASRSKPGSGP